MTQNQDLRDHQWQLQQQRVHGESLLNGDDLTDEELRQQWERRLEESD